MSDEVIGLTLEIDVNISPSYGGLLIGILVSNTLLGATCIQVYHYFRRYNDPILLRVMVFTLLVLDILQSAFSMHAIYHFLIVEYSHPVALLSSVWSANATILIKVQMVVLVQSSYAIRIYYVSARKILVPVLLLTLSMVALGVGCGLMVDIFHNPFIPSMTSTPIDLTSVIYIIGAFSNFLVVGTLGHYLNKSRTGFKQTEKLVDRLIIHLINHGLLTGVIEITCIVLSFIRNSHGLAVSQVVGSVYANSWMATLNSRARHETHLLESSMVFESHITSFAAISSDADKLSPPSISSESQV